MKVYAYCRSGTSVNAGHGKKLVQSRGGEEGKEVIMHACTHLPLSLSEGAFISQKLSVHLYSSLFSLRTPWQYLTPPRAARHNKTELNHACKGAKKVSDCRRKFYE